MRFGLFEGPRRLFMEGEGEGGGGQGAGSGGAGEGGGEGEGSGSGEGSGDANEFLATLPEGIQGHTSLQKFTSVEALANSYINAEQLIGRDKIPMPKSDEEWGTTYDRLGRPEKADLYEGVVASDAVKIPEVKAELEKNVGWFKETCHKHGLSQKQTAALWSDYSEQLLSNTQAGIDVINHDYTEAETALKAELGTNYEGKMTLMNRAVEHLGGKDLVEAIRATGAGRNPEMIKAFMKIGEMMAEDLGIDKTTGGTVKTVQDVDAEIETAMADPAYLDKHHPSHNTLVQKVLKLNEIKVGVKAIPTTTGMSRTPGAFG